MELLMPLDAEDDLEILTLIAVVKETVVTDLLKTSREHVHHQPSYELLWSNTDCLQQGMIAVILSRKGNSLFGDTLYPGVGDGDTVSVTSQVFKSIAKAIKGLPDVWTPLYLVESVQELLETEGVAQLLAGRRENKLAFLKSIRKRSKELPPELACQDFGREKEMSAAFLQLQILSESSAGDDTVDVGMEIQLLSPGVQDLYNTGSSAEEPGVLRTFQQSMCRAGVHQGIEKLLIGVDQGVELCGEGKDHMEIRCINDFRLP